jgi:acetylornithine aminotransferase
VIERDGLLAHVTDLGAWWRSEIAALGHPLVAEVRGEGLLIAVQLAAPVAAEVASRALAAGFIVNPCTPQTIRMAPPYVLTREQAATFTEFLAALPHDLGAAA